MAYYALAGRTPSLILVVDGLHFMLRFLELWSVTWTRVMGWSAQKYVAPTAGATWAMYFAMR